MWILVILNGVFGSDEVKMTYYDLYQTEMQCNINAAVLETAFTQKEKAICINNS
jgi:hypothetical protein